jgi:dipeptidase
MNEKQLSIGESTCSGVFSAKGAHRGGDALFCVNELSRVAMERCVTARCAVALMGDLAERYGFYGASGGVEGGSETLLVADTTEGWVMHFVPYPANNSAVWVARRVPDDEVTVAMNMFTIREVPAAADGRDGDDDFMHSANMLPVAIKHGLWNPIGSDGPFDFTRAFSDGEYAHKYYSGRRVWGAFRCVRVHRTGPHTTAFAMCASILKDFSSLPRARLSARRVPRWCRSRRASTPHNSLRH